MEGDKVQALTSEEVTKEVSFRKQALDRGLLLEHRVSMGTTGTQPERLGAKSGKSQHIDTDFPQGC